MTVTEALKSIRNATPDAASHSVRLACGFTPVHLQTFLAAHLQQRAPHRKIELDGGLYGDIPGTLEAAAQAEDMQGLAVVLEWADLDPRLGYRGSGAWSQAAIPEIVGGARVMLERIAASLLRQPAGVRIALSLPTLQLPPLFHPPGWQESEPELQLERLLIDFAASLGGRAAIVNRNRLAVDSPPHSRYDLKSDLLTGAPWTVPHADITALALSRLLLPAVPKKGVITDLDNTLWSGIVGDDGPENVSWNLTDHTQLHAVYQNLLNSLADQGVLIAVASKNDPRLAAQALARADMVLKPDRIFPLEIHWNSKSSSVTRILETWNIAADSVVFVDDSSMELAEVQAEHPGIECIRFPEKASPEAYQVLWRLRDLCGKEFVSDDDRLRLESIRQGAVFRTGIEQEGAGSERFLKDAAPVFTIDLQPAAGNKRVLELVNKTNQFNLNGVRYTEAEWARKTAAPGAFVAAIQYEDKFGPLGLIAVAMGTRAGENLTIDCWVMSCRAFARRIEYQCLQTLFDQFDATGMTLNFAPTPRNGPTAEFARAILEQTPDGPFALTRAQFETKRPALYHQLVIVNGAKPNG